MRPLSLALALSLFGCSSILGLDDFKDSPATGGSAGGGGTGGSGGTTGGSGGTTGGTGGTTGGSGGTTGGTGGTTGGTGGTTGGTGGTTGGTGGTTGGTGGTTGGTGGTAGATPWSCSKGPIVNLITPADFATYQVEANTLVAIAGVGFGHVGISASSADFRFLVRSVRNNPSTPLGNLAKYTDAEPVKYLSGNLPDATQVVFWGTRGATLSRLQFDLNAGGVIPAPSPHTAIQLPTECAGGTVTAAAYSIEPGSGGRPVFTCKKSGSPLYLFATLGTTVTELAQTSAGDIDRITPVVYAFANGIHFIGFKSGHFRFGSTAPELVQEQQLKVTSGSSMHLFAVPRANASDGIALAVTGTQSSGASTIYAGAVQTSGYGNLIKSPPTGLAAVGTKSNAPNFGMFHRRAVDGDSIVAARTDGAGAVYLTHSTREGTINLFDTVVYQAAANEEVLNAVAVQVGAYDAVAWVQKSGSQISVRALLLTCGP